jgi:putative transposase
METVHIYRLRGLSPTLRRRLYEAQQEAGRVWNPCSNLHLSARQQHLPWPQCDDLQRATKGGQFALHSQTVQMICHKFCMIVGNIRSARRANPRLQYPYREKRFHTLYWPAQAVSVERGRIVLPMGRGRPSLVLHVDVPTEVGAVQLVWNEGYELHISVPVVMSDKDPGGARAAVDLGEVRQAAITTNTGASLVVSGRGIRSLKRLRNKTQGQIAKKCARCQKGVEEVETTAACTAEDKCANRTANT